MRNQARSPWLILAPLIAAILAVPALPDLQAQDSRPAQAQISAASSHTESIVSTSAAASAQDSQTAETGVSTDWSSRHLVFSQPATAEQARRVQQDPRYRQQLDRNNQLRSLPPVLEPADAFRFRFPIGGGGGGSGSSPAHTETESRGAWSQSLNGNVNVGAGTYPGKYSFSLGAANCASAAKPDFVVYSTELQGSGIQATLVAYDNLYAGCSTVLHPNVPTVYWAYNTGNGTKILTSPAFSRDGSQVIFVQLDSGGATSSLVLLKWAASTTETVGGPMTLIPVSPSLYRGCTAPCETTLSLGATDSGSSVFPDLSNDTAWVGDDGGNLHKFAPVFLGVNPPAEVTTGGFPAAISTAPLTAAIHDFSSGTVFVGDTGSGGGFLYAVDSANGSHVTKSGQLDFGVGITGGPIVDSTAELVYVFSSEDGTGACMNFTEDCAGVWQLPTNFTSGETGPEVAVGNSVVEGSATPPNPLYIGAFDSTYLNSTTATGNLYVCGNTGGDPTLYQVPILAGGFGVPIPGPQLSNATPPCSPVSDIYNPNASGGPSEFFFVSINSDGMSTGCDVSGCIFNFNDTPWKPNTNYAVGQEVLDLHLHIQVVSQAGTSGATVPHWTEALGQPTTDNSVKWLAQGVLTATTPPAWMASTSYSLHKEILDSNGNIELATTTPTGMSGVGPPSWKTTAGLSTTDGTEVWLNVGGIPTNAAEEVDGTSGIIIDNTVGSSTILGGSQIYFFTLGNEAACGDGQFGRCAVQLSQSSLQ